MITNNQNTNIHIKRKNRKSFLAMFLVILLAVTIFAWKEIYNRPETYTFTVVPTNLNKITPTIIAATTTAATSTIKSASPPLTSTVSIMAPQSAPTIGHAIGIAAGGGLSKISLTDLNRELDQMVALGATWVRFDIEWGDVQYSSPNKSNWTNYDTLVQAITAHHLNALGIILFTPQWARDPNCTGGAKCPPQNPAQFATFAATVANRYKQYGLHYWEIWNEPNNYNFWATKTNCAAYTSLLKATYPAIKRVDPKAVIITGGLAPETTDKNNISQTDFLTCIYKNGGKNYFDAVGDHPYTFPNLPSTNPNNSWGMMSLTSPSLRSIMVANGDSNKKIWITEFGAPTNGPDPQWYVSEQKQSQMVTDAMDLYKTYSWAGPLFWYSLQDSGTTTDTSENFFGLLRADGSQKPAFATLQNIISKGL